MITATPQKRSHCVAIHHTGRRAEAGGSGALPERKCRNVRRICEGERQKRIGGCENVRNLFYVVCEAESCVTCSLHRAEAATKAKLEKATEIKRLNTQLMAVKKYVYTTYVP